MQHAVHHALCDRVRVSGLAIVVLFHSLFVSDLLTPTRRQVNDGCTETQLGLFALPPQLTSVLGLGVGEWVKEVTLPTFELSKYPIAIDNCGHDLVPSSGQKFDNICM